MILTELTVLLEFCKVCVGGLLVVRLNVAIVLFLFCWGLVGVIMSNALFKQHSFSCVMYTAIV